MGRGKRQTGSGQRSPSVPAALIDDTTLRVRGYDREFVVRVIHPGERYGRDRVLVNDRSEPLVCFHDANNVFPQGDVDERVYGQGTGGQYYLSTLLEHDPDHGLDLHGGVPEWKVPAESMREVLSFLRRQLPKPVRSRLSPLAAP